MTLIGLGGAARAGKNVVSQYIVDRYGFIELNFSDPLLAALETLDPLITVHRNHRIEFGDGSYLQASTPLRLSKILYLVGYTEAKRVPEVRRLLQTLGTDVVRDMIDEDAWVKAMSRRIAESMPANIVVTSIRFPNELDLIHQFAGHSVYVERREAVQPGDPASAHHASETSLHPRDFGRVLDNNGTIPELLERVDELILSLSVAPDTITDTSFEQSFESNQRKAHQ